MKKLLLFLSLACCSVAHAQFAVTRTNTNVVQQAGLQFVTPGLGVATATSLNGLTITSSTGTLTLANAKVFTVSNTLTLAGTDGSTLNVGTGGTLGTSAYITLGANVGTALAIAIGNAGGVQLNNGSGAGLTSVNAATLLGATWAAPGTIGSGTPNSIVGTTGVFGSATSLLLGTAGSAVGSVGFRNATSGTATLAPPTGALGTYQVTLPNAASTLPIFGQQITFAGPTAARTVTFPDAAFTAARIDAAQTFTGVQSMTSPDITTSLTTPSTTFSLLNTTATTVNFAGGASTALNIGHASGATSMLGIIGFDGATPSSSTAAIFPAATTGLSSLRVPHGTAPTSPVNGDLWTTTAGLSARINGATVTFSSGSGNVTNSGTLTSTAIATGAGTTVVQTPSATTTLDSSGNMAVAGNLTVSGTAGIVSAGSATGILQVTGVTSGAFKITGADAMAQTVTMSLAAQTSGAATVTIPDLAGVGQTMSFIGKAETLSGAKTFSGGVLASGANANDFSGGSGTFKTSTGAVTIGTGAVGITGITTFTPPVRTSGVAPFLRIITPADTGQTADTEFTGIFFGGDASAATVVRTGADGTTIATQRENRFIGPTYAFAGATTITDAFTVGMTPPVVGTNATFTRGHTLGILDSTSAATSITGGLVVAATFGTTATSVGIGGGNVFAGGNITATTSFLPAANDGAALGSTSLQFSDLFLAEGGVINFDNGDGTITQSGNTLTLAGFELIIEDASTYPTSTVSAGFRGMPQNSKSAAYTTVLSDAGKHILHPTADNNARTFTIDSNANVAYPIGTVITVVNQINTVTISITSDTLTWFAGSGTGSTGSRTLAAGGVATLLKVSSTGWIISGPGVSFFDYRDFKRDFHKSPNALAA